MLLVADRAEPPQAHDMRASYVRVILSWIAVLAALLFLQEYFSS